MTAPTGLQARVRVAFPRTTTFRHPEGTGWVVFPDMPMSQWQKVLRRRGWTWRFDEAAYVTLDEVPS